MNEYPWPPDPTSATRVNSAPTNASLESAVRRAMQTLNALVGQFNALLSIVSGHTTLLGNLQSQLAGLAATFVTDAELAAWPGSENLVEAGDLIAGSVEVSQLVVGGPLYIPVDNQGLWLGANNDAVIYYNGTAGMLVIEPGEASALALVGNLWLDADNDAMVLGTDGDAAIYYNGTNLIVNPKVEGAGKLYVLGDVALNTNDALVLGANGNAEIFYDGNGNLIINPKQSGSGILDVTGVIEADGYRAQDGTSGASATKFGLVFKNGLYTSGGLTGIGSSNQVVGVNAAGTAWEYKTLAGTTNQVTVTHAAGTMTLATPQNLHTAATPQFAKVKTGYVVPPTDQAGAVRITRADGTTPVVSVNTTYAAFPKVGIGTDNPQYILHIYSPDQTVGYMLETGAANKWAYNYLKTDLRHWSVVLGGSTTTASWRGKYIVADQSAGGAARLVVDQQGNVGIGTVIPDLTKAEKLTIGQGSVKFDDNYGAVFGNEKDAKIFYDGVDLIVNPKAVGSGTFEVRGNTQVFAGSGSAWLSVEIASSGTGDWAELEVRSPTQNWRIGTGNTPAAVGCYIYNPANDAGINVLPGGKTAIGKYNTPTDSLNVVSGTGEPCWVVAKAEGGNPEVGFVMDGLSRDWSAYTGGSAGNEFWIVDGTAGLSRLEIDVAGNVYTGARLYPATGLETNGPVTSYNQIRGNVGIYPNGISAGHGGVPLAALDVQGGIRMR